MLKALIASWLAISPAEVVCLAENVYHEARGEGLVGQMAVARVTMNRAISDRYPGNVCDVVRQGGERPLYRCQFSWYCDGRSDATTDSRALQRAYEAIWLAFEVPDFTQGALFYHTQRPNPPSWTRKLTVTALVGAHIFYKGE